MGSRRVQVELGAAPPVTEGSLSGPRSDRERVVGPPVITDVGRPAVARCRWTSDVVLAPLIYVRAAQRQQLLSACEALLGCAEATGDRTAEVMIYDITSQL